MNIGRYQFTPPWWSWFATLLVVAILSSLGVWQIHRAHYKQDLAAQQIAARDAGPAAMSEEEAASQGDARNANLTYGRQYQVTGHYDAAQQILLDNQVEGTQVGYRVWTPLVQANGVRVMIDRGWVPMPGQDRSQLPNPTAPEGTVTVSGFWRTFPQPGLGSGSSDCSAREWPRALNFPSPATVRCQYGQSVANGLLLLDPVADGGFVRDWHEETEIASPFEHWAYASQWFLMALIVIGIFIFVNSSRRSE